MTAHLKLPLQTLEKNSYLFSGNGAYLEALYEQYLHDPSQLSAEWQTYFGQLGDKEKDVSHADIRAYFAELAQRPAAATATAGSGITDLYYR